VAHKVEHLVNPVRDIFAAIFFVSVGMMIDPASVAEHWLAVLAFSAVIIVGNLIVVSTSAFLTGVDTRTSIKAGMSLGQIGEFSFIIAGLGLATGATGTFLYPVTIAISALTTLTTPLMIRSATSAAAFVDRALPAPLQTFVALYGSWIERLRSVPREPGKRSGTKRLAGLLLLDVFVLTILIIGIAVELELLTRLVSGATSLSSENARLAVLGLGGVCTIPLVFGFVTTARRLGILIATRALPSAAKGRVDFAAAPRRSLVTALQLAVVLLAGIPVVAITQPFLPPLRGVAVLAIVIAVLGIAFWRSATNLQGHAKAGAEVIAMALGKQMAQPAEAASIADTARRLDEALPGLGHPVAVRIDDDSPMIGSSLATLNLRGRTGATILAITREGEQILIPSGSQVLRGGDILALAGTHESVDLAKEILHPAPSSPPPPPPLGSP
jgi:CPA2 family monovalent cation:H+ antiporter-2